MTMNAILYAIIAAAANVAGAAARDIAAGVEHTHAGSCSSRWPRDSC